MLDMTLVSSPCLDNAPHQSPVVNHAGYPSTGALWASNT